MSRPAYVKGVPALTVELLSDPELFRDDLRAVTSSPPRTGSP